jgi:hypothetical protein
MGIPPNNEEEVIARACCRGRATMSWVMGYLELGWECDGK